GADLDGGGEAGQVVAGGVAGGHDEADDVVGDEVMDGDLGGGVLQGGEVGGVQDGPGGGRPRGDAPPGLEVFGGGGRGGVGLQEETVTLRFGQGVDAFGFDGVLGGQDDERAGEGVAAAAEGDLAFGHDLQEGGLDFGGGAVDLVGEDEVREDR